MSADQELETRQQPLAAPGPLAEERREPPLSSIQPGGGVCMEIELAWGRLRRSYLRRFRPAYVARMLAARRGEEADYPHEILDPRDLKFFRNRDGYHWDPQDDPFRWRDRLPFARVGLAELLLLGGGMFLLSVVLGLVYWPAAPVPAALGLGVCWFFRDPPRTPPAEAGLLVAPADGRVVELREIEHDAVLGGPAVQIGIFLSVFNVHINRAPAAARVVGIRYRPGKFFNALRSESARANEWLELRLAETRPPYRVLRVRQVAGAIARRIVCWAAPGQPLACGEQFGMIKLGSRTELTLPREPGLAVLVRPGQRVRAGVTGVARYPAEPAPGGDAPG